MKLIAIPEASKDWKERLDYKVRNDPNFRADGVESLAKMIDQEMCSSDGPDLVSTIE